MSKVLFRSPVAFATRVGAKRMLGRIVRRLAPQRHDLPLSTWGLAQDASGALCLRGSVLRELLERWGSPLHVVDTWRLTENASRFRARPAGAAHGCEVFCSYKTSPVPGILRILHADGLGAEVVSAYELWLALELGVDPRAIVYNGPARSEDSTRLALTRDVGLININSRSEIAPLAALARSLGKNPTVGIRVVTPGAVGGQFGERIDTGAALAAFREALRFPELRIRAIHSHYNGEIVSQGQLDAFLSSLVSFSDELFARLGLIIQILDVGGNLACPTVSRLSGYTRRLAVTFGCEPTPRPPDSVLSIDAYIERVVRRVEGHFTATGRPAPRIFVEPGRALTSNAQMLLCRVAAIRDPDETGRIGAVLDAGLHMAEPMGSEFHQLFPLAARKGAPARLYRLSGPSCMLSDQMYVAWRLPELALGDSLAIMDSGAYFVAFSSCFSFPRPGIVALSQAGEHVLRRAETFDDLIMRDDMSECVPGHPRMARLEGELSVAHAR